MLLEIELPRRYIEHNIYITEHDQIEGFINTNYTKSDKMLK